jgi:hypothetical protein
MSSVLLSRAFSWILILSLIVPSFFGYSVFDLELTLTSAMSAGLIGGSWIVILLSLMRFARLSDESLDYQWWIQSTNPGAKPMGWYARASTPLDRKKYLTRWNIADLWHDDVGGFHHVRPAALCGYFATALARNLRSLRPFTFWGSRF